jgi:hypothetical protein
MQDDLRRDGEPDWGGTSSLNIDCDAAVAFSCIPADSGGRIGIVEGAEETCLALEDRSCRPPTAQLQRGKEINPHEIKQRLTLKRLRALRCMRPLFADPIDGLASALPL